MGLVCQTYCSAEEADTRQGSKACLNQLLAVMKKMRTRRHSYSPDVQTGLAEVHRPRWAIWMSGADGRVGRRFLHRGGGSCIDPLQGRGKLRPKEARQQNAPEKGELSHGGLELEREAPGGQFTLPCPPQTYSTDGKTEAWEAQRPGQSCDFNIPLPLPEWCCWVATTPILWMKKQTPRGDPIMRGRAETGTHTHLTSPRKQRQPPSGPSENNVGPWEAPIPFYRGGRGLSHSRHFSASETESA